MGNKVVIAGGSGYLGGILIDRFINSGCEVVVLTRSNSYKRDGVSYIQWDAKSEGEWEKELEASAVVINLVGKSVNCRYTEKNKREIIASRVNATKAIGRAILKCTLPPKIWINAGSAAIYGNSGEEIKTEASTLGEGFSADVCKYWETAFTDSLTPETRKVFLRIGLVFEEEAWVLKPFITMAKWGLGGTIGSGEQYISWIHKEDFLNMIEWITDRNDVSGVINCSSPEPVKNKDFMKVIRKVYGVPFGIRHPSFLIKLGGYLIGTEGELVLTGRRVTSAVLQDKGFQFEHPEFEVALQNLAIQKQLFIKSRS